jgi:hypothetical protein
MRERAARQVGLTLEEYERKLVEKLVEIEERKAKRAERRVEREANRLTPEQRRAKQRAWNDTAYARDPSNWYAAAYRRRARLKLASVVEEIHRHDVFDRDGWLCRHCGRKVSDTVGRGHPHKAIMAHIVALAAGGDHSWDNVCCLCHECNCKDGVNKLPLQMRLREKPCK